MQKEIFILLFLFLGTNNELKSQSFKKFQDVPELFDSAVTRAIHLIGPFLSQEEFDICSKTKIYYVNSVLDGFMPTQTRKRDSFVITIPYKLEALIRNNLDMALTFSWRDSLYDRAILEKYYYYLYESANLMEVTPKSFIALTDNALFMPNRAAYIKQLVDYIEFTIEFILLHEFGHVVRTYKKISFTEKNLTLEEEKKCDEWAFRLLIKSFTSRHIPIKNDILLACVREAINYLSALNEGNNFLKNNISFRAERSIM